MGWATTFYELWGVWGVVAVVLIWAIPLSLIGLNLYAVVRPGGADPRGATGTAGRAG